MIYYDRPESDAGMDAASVSSSVNCTAHLPVYFHKGPTGTLSPEPACSRCPRSISAPPGPVSLAGPGKKALVPGRAELGPPSRRAS